MGCGASTESDPKRMKRSRLEALKEAKYVIESADAAEERVSLTSEENEAVEELLRSIAMRRHGGKSASGMPIGDNISSSETTPHSSHHHHPAVVGTFQLVKAKWTQAMEDRVAASKILQQCIEADKEMVDLHFSNVDLFYQSKRLINMVDRALDTIDDSSEFLTTMSRLGIQHNAWGIHSLEFDTIFKYLVFTLKERLGADYDADFDSSFRHVWGLIRSGMEQGARSDDGLAMRQAYLKRRMEMIADTWAIVKKNEVDAPRSFLQVWYDRAIEEHGVEMSTKLKTFTSRKSLVMGVFTNTIQTRITDAGRTESMLKALGSRHINYDVSEDDYKKMLNSFILALEHLVGAEQWNKDVEVAWRELWTYMTDLMLEGANEGLNSYENQAAPKQTPLALMFTDIENSTALWEADRAGMTSAVALHHQVVRSVVGDLHGYEVKTIGDAFLVAFRTVEQAAAAAVQIQLRLHEMDWGQFSVHKSKKVMRGAGPEEVWGQGLRVRIGLHSCVEVSPTYDPVHQRYDYYGPDVNVTSRVQSCACGGEIMMTKETYEILTKPSREQPSDGHRPNMSNVAQSSRRHSVHDGSALAKQASFDRRQQRRGSSSSSHRSSSAFNDLVHSYILQSPWKAQTAATGVSLPGVVNAVDLVSVVPLSLCSRQFPTPEFSK